jgi:choline dehydrogenase-like flavoprotein
MTATGVEVTAYGSKFTLSAKREIVLSAGALQSPQLLMASDIGPRDELEKINIEVLVDRPGVGQNWQVSISILRLICWFFVYSAQTADLTIYS